MADYSIGARDESHESEATHSLMFCLTMFPQNSLASSSIAPFSFALSTNFVFLKATRRERNLPQQRKFFPVSRSPLRGKQAKETSSRSPKELISKFVVIWLKSFIGSTMGAVEVHSLGDY